MLNCSWRGGPGQFFYFLGQFFFNMLCLKNVWLQFQRNNLELPRTNFSHCRRKLFKPITARFCQYHSKKKYPWPVGIGLSNETRFASTHALDSNIALWFHINFYYRWFLIQNWACPCTYVENVLMSENNKLFIYAQISIWFLHIYYIFIKTMC